MKKLFNKINATWNRFVAFIRSDVRAMEARCQEIESRLVNEVATLRAEAAKTEAELRDTIAALESELTQAVRFLSNTKRDSAGLRGDKPALLKQGGSDAGV